MLENEPESFTQCPLNEGGRDAGIAPLLDLRLVTLDGQSNYTPPTPEIRLEFHSEEADGSTTVNDTVTVEGTTLMPSRKCMFGYAHPKHCSALLRLLYFHMTINPGNISPHLSSLLVPLYSVLMQEVDSEELAHVEADTFWLFEAILAELLGLEDNSGKDWMNKLSERLAWADNDLFVHLVNCSPYCNILLKICSSFLSDVACKGVRSKTTLLLIVSPGNILQSNSVRKSNLLRSRWLMPVLTHTLPLSSVFLVWDAIFSGQARDKDSNPKLEFFLDVCTSMIIRTKPALYR